MKRIKLLLLLLLPILTTGCSVEYNITINDKTIKEEIIVDDKMTSTRTKDDILKHYNKWYPTYVNYIKDGESIPLPNFNNKVDGIEYYNKSIEENTDGYKYKYTYNHNIYDYYDAFVLANTYEDTTVQESPNALVLRTSTKNFLCNYNYFDSLTVNITVDSKKYSINYNNANSSSGNTYTWTINRNNCNNSQIVLTLDKVISNDSDIKQNQLITESDLSMYILCGILLLIAIIGYFTVKKYKRKLDDFDIDD